MKTENLSLEDGALMRSLLDFPGGLELHIGVSALGSFHGYSADWRRDDIACPP